MTYVVSNLHGHYEEFKTLLQTVKFNQDRDIMYVLGDIVDIGPDAPEGINRPTGTILSYPVISGGDKAHKGSIKNVSGCDPLTDEAIAEFSLELHVDETTSPAFIWHTFTDKTVPVENALLYASALTANKVPFELHIYPEGKHGLALCNEVTWSQNPDSIVPHCEDWINLAIKWAMELK